MNHLVDEALERARHAAANPIIIHTHAALKSAAESWRQRAAIGLDTEFVRERTFFAQPGLVQLSDGETAWLLDPLAVSDLSPLRDMLDNPSICKILHSVGEDLEVLNQLTGTFPEPLFDTQVAAALIGHPMQLAYERLVAEELGESLPGGKARSDWLQRPLPRELLGYAAQDVVYLPQLQAHLTEKLQTLDRLEWLQEDCARIVDAARAPAAPELAWQRVRGAARLEHPDACYRLIQLATWRERQAMRRDRPRRFILKDAPLIAIARHAPADAEALAAIPDLPAAVRRRHTDALLECARAKAPQGFTRPASLDKLNTDQRDRLAQLQQQTRRAAEQLGLEAPVIASKRELVAWLQEAPPDWLQGWRGRYLGQSAKI